MPEIRDLMASSTPGQIFSAELVEEVARLAWKVTGADRLAAEVLPVVLPKARDKTKRSRRRKSRQVHLDQAVRAARHYLSNDPTRDPTEQDICDFIATEDGIACTRSTLTTRWRRLKQYGEAIITIDEVIRIARS